MQIRERKEAALQAVLTAHDDYFGQKPTAQDNEYRRKILKVLATSPRVWVKLEDKEPDDIYRPFADLKLDELFKPIDF